MRVETESYIKNHRSVTIEVSKPLLQERKGDVEGDLMPVSILVKEKED